MTRPEVGGISGQDVATQLDAYEVTGQLEGTNAQAVIDAQFKSRKNILRKIPPTKVNASNAGEGALRYPLKPGINKDSDYVVFEFYDYLPPFQKNKNKVEVQGENGTGIKGNFSDYNQIKQYKKKSSADGYAPILMYMPEDISTGFRSNWGGKAVSTFATDALAGLSKGDLFSKIRGVGEGFGSGLERSVPILGAAAIRKGIQKITGDSLSNDDIFGGISGAILNPNVELLYQGTDLRNFSLNFKLVPRNEDESEQIIKIQEQFKKASLPKNTPGNVFGSQNAGIISVFIGVPTLCRVSFMKGPNESEYLPRYKMCAITQVLVNYTPDGTYATYTDGMPVAVQLTLSFQETKLIFAEDIEQGSR